MALRDELKQLKIDINDVCDSTYDDESITEDERETVLGCLDAALYEVDDALGTL